MKILGNIKIEGQNQALSIEKDRNLYKYYLDDRFIGVFDPNKMMDDRIVFRENTLENELSAEARDQITQFLDDREVEEIIGQRDEIEQEDERAEHGRDDKDKKQTRKEQEISGKKTENYKPQPQQTTMQNKKPISTTKDINILETVDTDEMVTNMSNLGQVLRDEEGIEDVNGQEIEKVGVVYSDDINKLVDEEGKSHSGQATKYTTVGINKDEEVVDLGLEQDSSDGVNSSKRNYQISQDGEVTKDDVNTRLKVGEGTISLENEDGEIKVHHSAGKSLGGEGVEGNMSLDRELGNSRTGNLHGMRDEVRELAAEYSDGYRNVEDIYQEAEEHEENGCEEELELSDVDGEKDTMSHTHNIEDLGVDFEKLAKMWSLRDDKGNYSPEKAQKLYEEAKKENPGKDSKKLIDMIDEELNDQMQIGGRSR